MKIPFYALVLILTLTIPSTMITAFAQQRADLQSIQAEGGALIKDNNLARAQIEAIQDALRVAVEKSVMQLLPPERIDDHMEVLQKTIYGAVERYIQTYKIIAEMPSQEEYRVDLKAMVDHEALREELKTLGILVAVTSVKKIVTISMIVRGIRDYPTYARFIKTLQNDIDGVKNVRILSARQGSINLNVDTEGSLSILVDKLGRTGQFSYNLNQTNDNELEIMLLDR